ncbi:hypothetical protein ACT3SZ_01430 [Corynebacterium sp. AOP40-9SA-29]
MAGRFTGDARSIAGLGSGSGPAPVLLTLADPGLVDEVSMVVAATGRRLVGEEEASGLARLVVVTDSPGPTTAKEDEPQDAPASVRTIRVTGMPFTGGSEAGGAGTPALQIPESSGELAAMIGSHDPVNIAVAGIVGGAGTSVFAAALAGALAAGAGTSGGAGQALLVDDDPLSRPGQLRLLLGAEVDPDFPGNPDGLPGVGDSAATVTWVQDVGILEARDIAGADGTDSTAPSADPSCPVVRDCGRRDLATVGGGVTARVLVVPQSVPAVLAARRVVQDCDGIHVVLRELPRSGLTWNQTLSLLGRAPAVTWEDDPFLTVDVDRGDFRTTGSGAGTAGPAAARLVEEIR